MISLRNKIVRSFAAATENFEQIAKAVDPGTLAGLGSPEGVVRADIGSLYRRRDGGVGTTLYVKEANSGGNTGWAAK